MEQRGEERICQNCKDEFTIEPEDFAFYEKIQVPPPTWCPECRMMRRFAFRNQRHLFRRKDDASGKEIFSGFPPHAKVTVYNHDYWWSDAWDSMQYGKEFDFSKPFFTQFRALLYSVPLFSKSVINLVNSDYCDQAGWLKNAYLCFDAGEIENSSYLVSTFNTKESLDLYQCDHDELCYEDVMVDQGYRVFFSRDCDSSNDVWFSQDMSGCTNCFGCSHLRNKQYHIFNKPHTREEYFETIKSFNLGSSQSIQEWGGKAHNFWLRFPMKYMHGSHNVNAAGEHLQNTKNISHSYFLHDGQDMRYCQILLEHTSDGYDWTNFGYHASQVYESVTCGFESANLKFCWECWRDARDLEYSAFCSSSVNLFGCVGLRKKQYCILNRQYSKEDYFLLREKIIAHMDTVPFVDQKGRRYGYGEFFPAEFSPFSYHETMAQDFFPLTKEEAEQKGLLWHDPDSREFRTTIPAAHIPDHIDDVRETILKELIGCQNCGKAYRIIPPELEFYKKIGLPLPRQCVNCRFMERMKLVNPPKFWARNCQCTGAGDDRKIYQNQETHPHGPNHCLNEFETSYAPERKEIVYCEECYQPEVI